MILVIASFILVLVLGTFSYAFFNYTRTGGVNNVRVGRINFSSTQNNTINLSDVFPTDSSHLDNTNSSTVTIGITGDTNYEDGIEYKVSIDQVTNTVNNKEVPISFNVTTSNLGTKSSDYYNERGSTTNVFNLRESGIATNGEDIVIGYIKPDENGVNGSINITAYIDNDSVAISDTVSTIVNDNLVYGETPGDWIAGRTVLTTAEWNSLSTNGISFKVKVEANEGVWVEEPEFIVLKNLNGITEWQNIRSNITGIEFSVNNEIPANAITSFDATGLSSISPVTVYTLDDGLGNNTYKAVICADDVIYAPSNSSSLFFNLSKLEDIDFTYLRTDNVTNAYGMFANCVKLDDLSELASWNVSSVTNMGYMFYYCSKIEDVDALINWNTMNLTATTYMFYGCAGLEDVDGLINWNVGNLDDVTLMFRECKSLTNVNGLINWNVSNLTTMTGLFYDCESLVDIRGLRNWNTSGVIEMRSVFNNCYSLVDFSPIANWNTGSTTTMRLMFGMDNGKMKSNNPVIDFSPLTNWNVSNVTNMSAMFQNVNVESYLPFRNWNVSNVVNFTNMFNATKEGSPVTTLEGLENWNVSSATNMTGMFYDNASLVDASAINDWNINANIVFTEMFNNSSVYPNFTRVVGTWSENGTFTPTP